MNGKKMTKLIDGCSSQVMPKIEFKKKIQDGASSPKMIKLENPKPKKTKNN
ncbi:hypothetical protein [Campylobacter lari]|uniref:hypothetical protein n=1 Tax=Campylobacter lari TaxID=201 RepID=UPI001D36CB44|nr:hypothetical protein [Campylobacter lari]